MMHSEVLDNQALSSKIVRYSTGLTATFCSILQDCSRMALHHDLFDLFALRERKKQQKMSRTETTSQNRYEWGDKTDKEACSQLYFTKPSSQGTWPRFYHSHYNPSYRTVGAAEARMYFQQGV
jgi:hypothetical protein